MAALRIFARSKLSVFLRASLPIETSNTSPLIVQQVQKRWGSYKSSPKLEDPSRYTEYDVTKDPKEWESVERLLRTKQVPLPDLQNLNLPSGWKPPVSKPKDYPYYVKRTKNYMIPVYLQLKFRGARRLTVIKRVQGDIWTFERELRNYIQENVGKSIGWRVNELIGEVKYRGDYVSLAKKWMELKGF